MLLTRLVGDLREIALADAGRLSLHREPADLADIVERAVAAFQVHAGEHQITLHGEIATGLPRVNLDAQRIDQVLRNLISNTIRYSPAGASVNVHLARASNSARVEVRDTGPGMPPDAVEHVFERFWRADPSRSRLLGGAGLGLAIAKQWIEAHGGQIGVESRVGQGSTFWFTLPL